MWRATRFDTAPGSRYESPVPKKPSHVPSAVGAIPVVGDAMRSAEAQARWMQELLEQNARLVGQVPATMKTFNDSLERFNQTVQRLDRVITRVETTTAQLSAPIEELAPRLERLVTLLDVPSVRDLPGLVDTLRREALPALRAATDTQRQVALLQTTVDRIAGVLAELPGAGILRRLAGAARPAAASPPEPGSAADAGSAGPLDQPG